MRSHAVLHNTSTTFLFIDHKLQYQWLLSVKDNKTTHIITIFVLNFKVKLNYTSQFDLKT